MKSDKIVADKLIGTPCETEERTFTDRDSILYALGIGFSRGTAHIIVDPMRQEDYKYTSEID